MTKIEKMTAFIRKDFERGFIYELKKALATDQRYVKKINENPKFMEAIIQEGVAYQVNLYSVLTDEEVDAAYNFFMSPTGDAYVTKLVKVQTTLSAWSRKFAMEIARRLDSMSNN